jgi:hypothetical protein
VARGVYAAGREADRSETWMPMRLSAQSGSRAHLKLLFDYYFELQTPKACPHLVASLLGSKV